MLSRKKEGAEMSVHRLHGGQLLFELDDDEPRTEKSLKVLLFDAATFLLTFLFFGILTLDVLVKVRG